MNKSPNDFRREAEARLDNLRDAVADVKAKARAYRDGHVMTGYLNRDALLDAVDAL
jgi:hypothetical protein